MEAIPDATEEEVAQVPLYLRELQLWLRSEGKSDTLVRQTVRNLVTLFEDDGKSVPTMTTLEYFELVKASPKNISRHNQRSSAVRNLQRFWDQRAPGPPQESSDDLRSLTPKPRRGSNSTPGSAAPDGAGDAPGSTGAVLGAEGTPRSTGEAAGTPANGAAEAKAPSPGSVGAAASPGGPGAAQGKEAGRQDAVPVESKRKQRKRELEKAEKKRQKRLKKLKREEERRKREPAVPLSSVPGAEEVLKEAKQLAKEGRIATAICLVGRGADRKNASMNGVYLDRGKLYHGRTSFKKEGGDRFLFFSSTKGAWKVSNNLDDNKTGFAFAKVEDRGAALPSEPSQLLVWRACDGKEEGYKKDASILCLPAPALLRKMAPEFAAAHLSGDGKAGSESESDGEQGSDSSSCEQGSEHSSDDEKGTMSSSSSSSSGGEED